MVKTLSTALVCGIVLIAHSHAQDVFSGEQKAKPKYPKAQPATADHAKSEIHIEKAVAVQSAKAEAAPKQPSASKTVVAQNQKHDAPVVATKKAPPAPTEPANKAASSSLVKASVAQNDSQDPGLSSAKKPSAPATKAASKTTSSLTHKAPVPTNQTAKIAAASPAKTNIPPTTVSPVVKAAPIDTQPSKGVATAKVSKVETSPARSAVVASPAEGPKHEAVAHVTKKAPVVEVRPVAVASKATSAAIRSPEDSGAEDSAPLKILSPKPVAVTSPAMRKSAAATRPPVDIRPVASSSALSPVHKEPAVSAKSLPAQNPAAETMTIAGPADTRFDTAFTKLADGFDFPVGKPDAQGYYKARGFRSGGHLGEDWDGVRGGDTDLGDPIFSIADGLVVFARDCHMGWGNVLIVRHSYRENGTVKTVDALYGHLNSMLVHRGQAIARGQKIATMGNAHGLYDAHLHLEVRKNLEIGMSRSAFARDFSNYYDPTQFIQAHRHLQTGGGTYRVAMNTFSRDAHIKWDKVRNYSHAHTGGGSSESAAALKRAVAAKH